MPNDNMPTEDVDSATSQVPDSPDAPVTQDDSSVPDPLASPGVGAKGFDFFGSLDSQIPPTPNDWPRIHGAMQSAMGRLRSMQKSQGSVDVRTRERMEAFDGFLQIPGIDQVIRGYANKDMELIQQGVAAMMGQRGAPPQSQGNVQKLDGKTLLDLPITEIEGAIQTMVNTAIERAVVQRVNPLYDVVGGMKQEAGLAQLRAKYADLPRFERDALTFASQNPNLTLEDAYLLVKARSGGFGRAKPNAQNAFSEGAGGRPESDGGVDDAELQRRDILKATW